MYEVFRLEMEDELNQWVEVYKNCQYQIRLLVGKNQTDSEIIEEMFNSYQISKLLF